MCNILKEAGWSTNEPSDLPKNLGYNLLSYFLLFSEEKIQIIYLFKAFFYIFIWTSLLKEINTV